MSTSFYCILSGSIVVVQFIALYYTYAHKAVLILVTCFTHLVSISQSILFHITCIYSLPEQVFSLLYPISLSLKSGSMQGSSHIYETRLLVYSQMVNLAILTAFVLRYCSCLLVFNRWLTRYLSLTHTQFFDDSVVHKLHTFIGYEPGPLALIHHLPILYLSQLPITSLCLLPKPQALVLLGCLTSLRNLALHSNSSLIT